MESEHDTAFLAILHEEKNITNFLDAFFGFLCRCTDFYVECGPEQKLGFPPGVAEKLVVNSLHKWKRISTQPSKSHSNNNQEKGINSTIDAQDMQIPAVAEEVEVEVETEKPEHHKTDQTGSIATLEREQLLKIDRSSESYNGAVRENYSWSQTIIDLDVIIKLPSNIKTSKDLKVDIDSQRIKVTTKIAAAEWMTIFDGELCFKTRKDESIWSIVPGQYINIHLEKATERWWEALIIGEPTIELNKIDCSQNLYDMGSTEQMKVQEIMWNHQQKLLGKPTSEEIKIEEILKKAWDAEGSPFQGTPYDPSVVKFS